MTPKINNQNQKKEYKNYKEKNSGTTEKVMVLIIKTIKL